MLSVGVLAWVCWLAVPASGDARVVATPPAKAVPPVQDYPLPSTTTAPGYDSIAFGDLRGSGVNDLVVGGTAGVNVLLGGGDGTFGSSVAYDMGRSYHDVAVGHFEGQAKPADIVGSNGTADTVSVLFGSPSGVLGPPVVLAIPPADGSRATALAVGDLTKNGLDDIVVGTDTGIVPFISDGAGHFTAGAFQPWVNNDHPMTNDYRLAIGDVNGDGNLDIVSGGIFHEGGGFCGTCAGADVFSGDGAGGFATGSYVPLGNDYTSFPDVTLATLGPSALPDLVGEYFGGGRLTVDLNNGSGGLSGPGQTYGPGGANDVASADLDGNGTADIVTAGNANASPRDGVIDLGHNDGTLTPSPTTLPTAGFNALIASDSMLLVPVVVATNGAVVRVILNPLNAPARCAPEVRIGLLDATGCLYQGANGTYTSTASVRVNGVDFVPSAGGAITLDPGSSTLQATGDGTIKLAGVTVWAWHGSLSLAMPSTGPFTLIPAGTKATIFGFSVSAALTAQFLPGGQIVVEGSVGLRVVGEDVQAAVTITASDRSGLSDAEIEVSPANADTRYHAFQFCNINKPAPVGFSCASIESARGNVYSALLANEPGIVRIGGVLPVEDLELSYDAAKGTWAGKASLAIGDILPGATAKKALPTLEVTATIGTRPFRFIQAGAGTPGAKLQIGPATLTNAAFSITVSPRFAISGSADLQAGPGNAFQIGAGFSYKAGSQSGFDVRLNGTFTLESQLTVRGDLEYDGRDGATEILAHGTFTRSWGPASASLGLGGGVQPDHFQLTADGDISAFGADLHASGIVSDAGVGACGQLHVLFFNGEVGFKHFWSGRTDFQGCDFSGLYTVGSATSTAARPGRTTRLRPGLAREEFAIVGRGRPPAIRLIGPHGETLTTPTKVDKIVVTKHGLAVGVSSSHTAWFIVLRPAAGRWRIVPQPGSSVPTRYLQADALTPLRIHATVKGRGATRILSWRLQRQRGEVVRFIQEGSSTTTILTTTRSSGRNRFRAASGPTGTRRIVALIAINGFPMRTIVVARFHAEAASLPAVTHARYTLRPTDLTVTWKRLKQARHYDVTVRLTSGTTRYQIKGSLGRLSLPVGPGARVLTITITTTDGHGVTGKPVRARRGPG